MEPTHYSQLDPKSMAVSALRNELKARHISWKGLKSQLVARLNKTLKTEMEKVDDAAAAISSSSSVKDNQHESESDTNQESEKKTEVSSFIRSI